MIGDAAFRKDDDVPAFLQFSFGHQHRLCGLAFVAAIHRNMQMFEIGPDQGIIQNLAFAHKNDVFVSQDLIHHENIQIRGVVGDNDYLFVREFRTVLLHKNEKQNAQQIAPKQKHRRTPFAGFRAQDQQRCDGIKHK